MPDNISVGYIAGGGLREGFRIRLTVPAETVQEGSFVVFDSGRFRYYGLVTDLQLGATDPRFADEPGTRLQPLISETLLGKTLFTNLIMYPALMMDRGPDLDSPERAAWEDRVERRLENPGPKPVKTVPAHHVPVYLAGEEDVAQIFGEAGKGMFTIGHTLEQNYPVRLDLNRFVKRSSGIFGATGTGKSFLTRIVLAGLMRENVAGALVFDMHNEYAFDNPDPDENVNVKGLSTLFGSKVQVAALGKGALVRGHTPDFTLEIAMEDFQVSDIRLLAESLRLTDTADVTMNALLRSFGRQWFVQFMRLEPGAVAFDPETGKQVPAANSVAAWAQTNNIHVGAAEALHRRLQLISDKNYVVERPANDAVGAIVDKLENGRHVILGFGQYESELDYLLVSNILTRRIRQHWVKKSEAQRSLGEPPPRPLLIAVEEAHKLLNPQVSGQTAFGTIARELRKYNVTLLVVDQRPSGIDDEVMSQLGTRITGWLGDSDDIRAVLTGLAGREQLRGMLARLQEKEEVLLLGWGVKMPIPVKSRRYDESFYAALKKEGKASKAGKQDDFSVDEINEMFGLGS
jgi:DNA helicase HerA-like ATPase